MEGTWFERLQGDGWVITRPANIPLTDAWLSSHCRCPFQPEVLFWTLCDGQRGQLRFIVVLGDSHVPHDQCYGLS